MGGVILLLVVGTQILDWPWILALVLGTAGIGIRSVLRRIPSRYVILQSIDRRLELSDCLSTAFFYKELAGGRRASEALCSAQWRQAEQLSREVDLSRAVPIGIPRSLYMLAALGVVASSLFALRYGVSQRLDLRPPIATILFGSFYRPAKEQTVAKKKDLPERLKKMLKEFGLAVENKAERPEAGDNRAPESDTGELARAEDASTAKGGRPDQPKPTPLRAGDEQASEGDPSDLSREALDAESSGERASSEAESQTGSENSPSNAQQASNFPENKNLLEQFREAMANLLSRLKSQPRPGNSQMLAASSRGEGEPGRSRQKPGQKGTPGSGRQQSDGSSQSDSPGDEEAEGSQQAQSASGKPGGKESDMRASKEGRSGIGKEDGTKEAREAEQLAAMGKISEILGRRAANLSGEVTVEVASGTQRLRTPYSQQQATHAEAGREIHRDEVPLLYQQYVRQYFEEVRKTPPPAAKPGPQQP